MEIEKLELSDQKSVMQFLQSSTIQIAEIITGILVAGKTDLKLSAGKLVQAIFKGQLFTQFGRELKSLQDAGKIKEDYLASRRSQASLYELLMFLDEEVPDEELFRAAKSIFFSGISLNATQQDESLSYEFLKTLRKMSGTEILIIKANFEIVSKKSLMNAVQDKSGTNLHYRKNWRRHVAQQMGYSEIDSVVLKYEANLESLGLISPRNSDNRFETQFEPTSHFRLTGFGLRFCEFMMNFDDVNSIEK